MATEELGYVYTVMNLRSCAHYETSGDEKGYPLVLIPV